MLKMFCKLSRCRLCELRIQQLYIQQVKLYSFNQVHENMYNIR